MPFVLAFLLLFADEPAESLDAALKRFVKVFAAVRENAADKVDTPQALYEGAIPGMLKQLDPHSVFFTPAHFEQLKELEKSTRKGFGSKLIKLELTHELNGNIELAYDEGGFRAMMSFPTTPPPPGGYQ